MNRGKNFRKSFGVALVVLLVAGVPAEAKWWRILLGVASTVGGAFSSEVGIGVALIGLQGTLLAGEAHIANDPTITVLANYQPTYANGSSNPQVCADGGLSCPAIQALQRMVIEPIRVQSDWTPAEVDFASATNRVIEDENLFASHDRAGASLEVKLQDLRLLARSLEAAAQAYDRLNVPASESLTQKQIDSFQKQAGTSGLPAIEQSFWQNSNLTGTEVSAIAQFLATTDVKLGVPSVSMSRILHEEAASLAAAAGGTSK
jgi:hypothetical protein